MYSIFQHLNYSDVYGVDILSNIAMCYQGLAQTPLGQARTWQDFDKFLVCIKSDDLRNIAQKWRGFGDGVRIPAWRDIDPFELKKYLPILWSWKYDIESKSFTGRLAGEDIVRAHGRSLRGASLNEFFPRDSARKIRDRYLKIVSESIIMHGVGRVFKSFDGYGVGERVAFPLSEDGINCDGVFGATTYSLRGNNKDVSEKIITMNEENVHYYNI